MLASAKLPFLASWQSMRTTAVESSECVRREVGRWCSRVWRGQTGDSTGGTLLQTQSFRERYSILPLHWGWLFAPAQKGLALLQGCLLTQGLTVPFPWGGTGHRLLALGSHGSHSGSHGSAATAERQVRIGLLRVFTGIVMSYKLALELKCVAKRIARDSLQS